MKSLRRLLQRLFFLRNAHVVSTITSRAVHASETKKGPVLLSKREVGAVIDWAEEYSRRVRERRQKEGN